jgi:hypothetical protein
MKTGIGYVTPRAAVAKETAGSVVTTAGSLVARGLVKDDLERAEGREGRCGEGEEGCEGSNAGIVDDESVGRVEQSSRLGVDSAAGKQ